MALSMVLLVLIETYWNVKSDSPYASTVALLVLIETYWNVKRGVVLDSDCCTSINRNILECKGKKATRSEVAEEPY